MKKCFSIIGLVLLTSCGANTPVEGEKIGQIVKVSKSGIFSETWEAEMIRGGFQAGSGANGQSFHFTIPNVEMAKEAQRLMENQKEIILTYRTQGFYSAFSSDSAGNFANSIKERQTNSISIK